MGYNRDEFLKDAGSISVKLSEVIIDEAKSDLGNVIDSEYLFISKLNNYNYCEIIGSEYCINYDIYCHKDIEGFEEYKKYVDKLFAYLFIEDNGLPSKAVINDNLKSVQNDSYCYVQGKSFKFKEDKLFLEASSKEFKSPVILLFNEKESIIVPCMTDGREIIFEYRYIDFKNYKLFILDNNNVCLLCFSDPDVISVEPEMLCDKSNYKISYENMKLNLERRLLNSFVTLEDVSYNHENLTIRMSVNNQEAPNECKILFLNTCNSDKEYFEIQADITSNNVINCEVPLDKISNYKNISLYLSLKYKDYEKICDISGKGAYYEKQIKLPKKNILVMTNKINRVVIEVKKHAPIISRKINNIRTNLMGFLIKKTKVNNKRALFESYNGRQYSCHPKAIYEYVLKEYPEIKCIWSVQPGCEKVFKENKIPYVKRFSFKWFYYMCTSRYWISNSRFPLWVQKRNETLYLQTWHGTPLKRLGKDINEVSMPNTNTFTYNRNFYRESRNWDYLISPNRFCTNVFSRAFSVERNKIIESGSPRNDFLVNNSGNKDLITGLKVKLGIPLNKKVILYAPTWRDDQYFSKSKYKFTSALDLEKLKRELDNEYVVILRMHYLVADSINLDGYEGFAFNMCSGDISDLYLISDILITDYSSVFFDYAVLNRPMLFFMYDIEDYRDRLRGFYLDVDTFMPGPIVKTNDELIKEIKSADVENDKMQDFIQKFCSLEDGSAAKRACDVIFNNYKG